MQAETAKGPSIANEPRQNDRPSFVARASASSVGGGNLGADWSLECPMPLPIRTFRNPSLDELDLLFAQCSFRLWWRHYFVWIIRSDATEQLTIVWIELVGRPRRRWLAGLACDQVEDLLAWPLRRGHDIGSSCR